MQQGKPDGGDDAGKKAGPARDGVDELVSGFLEELDGISSEVKEIPHLEIVEKAPVEHPSTPSAPSTVPETPKEIRSETGLDIEEIKKELEESLDELERLKAKVIPIADRKDTRADPPAPSRPEMKTPVALSTSEPPAPSQKEAKTPAGVPEPAPPASARAKMNLPAETPPSKPAGGPGPVVKPPAGAPAAKARAKAVEPPATRESEEQAWNRLELFRSQVASRKPFPWLKSVIWIAILACVLGIAAYMYSTRRSVAPLPADEATALPAASTGQTPGFDTETRQDPVAAGEPVKAQSIHEVRPVYPMSDRRRGITGTVVLEADISETGEVIRARAVSGPSSLRRSAEEALMKWKFRPASADGVSIASRERRSMEFRR